jgi:hypothetical protein
MAKKKTSKKPKVHKELKGLEMSIDSFGEIKTTLNIENINAFLDKHVDDKKLREKEEKELAKEKKKSGS